MNVGENQIVVYQPNETVRLDVRLENETVWLTQLKIADLFGVQKAAISKHIKNIFASGELIKEATVSKMETVQAEGGRTVVRVQTKEPPLQGIFYQGSPSRTLAVLPSPSRLPRFCRNARRGVLQRFRGVCPREFAGFSRSGTCPSSRRGRRPN